MSAVLCLGCTGMGAGFAAQGAPVIPALSLSAANAHITDAQDRMMPGLLLPAGERISEAAALYAHAVVTFEGHESDSTKALEELRKVVALDPHNDQARIRMANVLLQTGQIEAAFDELQAMGESVRRSPELEALLGYTQHLRGQNDDALRLSTHALTKDPTQAASMRVLLEIAAGQNDLSGAVIHIKDILKSAGASVPASAWLTLGRLYVEIARSSSHALPGDQVLKTLLPIYQEAAAKPPPDVERLTLLSEAYQDLSRNDDALRVLRQAVKLEPENVDVILRCARLEMVIGDKTAALKDFQLAYQLNPSLTGLREILGRTFLDAGKYSDAVRVLQDALTDSPGNPGLQADLGLAYEGLHDPATAATWFQRSFSSPSCPPEAYLKLAVFQLNSSQGKKAAETLAVARTRFPQSAQVLFYQAIQNRYAKNYSAALACLDQMRELSSSGSEVFDPGYYLESALVLSLAHQQNRIEPLLREGLGKFPNDSDIMNELAFAWADAGVHLPEALTLAKRAAQIDSHNGAIQDTVGWALFKMGDAREALPYLQRAVILTNNDSVVLEHVGDAWLKLGHRREASAAYRLAQRRNPADHQLATRIAAALAQANHAHSRSAPLP